MVRVAPFLLVLCLALALGCQLPEPGPVPWDPLEAGLELGTFPFPVPAERGDSQIRVLRIDPQRFRLKLCSASAPGQGKNLTARDWALTKNLVAVINAGMYGTDESTAVSMLKSRQHTNNPRLTRDKAVLVFDPLKSGLPPVQIIDREFQDFARLSSQYGSFVQSIRMISLERKNVWSPQPRRYSNAAVGMDRSGKVLFIHTRSPYSTHDLANRLLDLPLAIRNAMYLEGGPAAQLFIRTRRGDLEFNGLPEIGLFEESENPPGTPIPNVLGLVRSHRSKP